VPTNRTIPNNTSQRDLGELVEKRSLELQKLVGNQSKITQSAKTDDKDIRQQDAGDITRWYTEQLKKRDVL